MAAPKGNEYYKIRLKSGRKPKYETAEELLEKANEYFKWCLDNPFKEEVVFHNKGELVHGEVSKIRPFTLEGLADYLNITKETFGTYSDRGKDFFEVCTRVRQTIYKQKFEGAAAGFFNSSIIARDLGLSDKQETTHTGNVVINETRED